jgi:hypothetical protein
MNILTDCTAQCCSIIYYLPVKEDQLWQNNRNSSLCDPQLAAERLNTVHKLSRETHMMSPCGMFTDGTVETFMNEQAMWRSRDLPTQAVFHGLLLIWCLFSCTNTRLSVIYRQAAISFYYVFYAQWSTIASTSWNTSQKITMWLIDSS